MIEEELVYLFYLKNGNSKGIQRVRNRLLLKQTC